MIVYINFMMINTIPFDFVAQIMFIEEYNSLIGNIYKDSLYVQ